MPKLARFVRDRLEQAGFDPIAGMIRIGLKAEEAGELNVARQCYEGLAQFVYPRLRAVEHTGVDGGPIQIENGDPYDAFARDITLAIERKRAREDHPQSDARPN